MKRNSGLSLAYQLEHQLRDKIVTGAYAVGARLLPEIELARQHGVSVVTVQRALAGLATAGLISRTRGRGTFVLDLPPEHASDRRATSLEMIFAPDFGKRNAKLISNEIADAPPPIQHLCGEAKTQQIRRVLMRGDLAEHFSINHISASLSMKVSARAIKRLPFGTMLRNEMDIAVTRVSAKLQARSSTSEVAGFLETEVAAPVFYMLTAFHQDDRIVAVNEIYFRADVYEFLVEQEVDSGQS